MHGVTFATLRVGKKYRQLLIKSTFDSWHRISRPELRMLFCFRVLKHSRHAVMGKPPFDQFLKDTRTPVPASNARLNEATLDQQDILMAEDGQTYV